MPSPKFMLPALCAGLCLTLTPRPMADPASAASTAHDREAARRASSQSNLKQIAQGVLLYEMDNDDHAPDAARWVDEIVPYMTGTYPNMPRVDLKTVFHDPSAPASQAYSYAYNRTLSHRTLQTIKAPASTVMLFESTLGVKNASDTGQSVPKPGRHLGGTDYAFADGHVKWLRDGAKPSYKLSGK